MRQISGMEEPPAMPTGTGLTTWELAEALQIDFSPSQLVRISKPNLRLLASHLSGLTLPHQEMATWGDPRFWNPEAPPGERSQYFAIGNAINFRFWTIDEGAIVPSIGVIDGHPLRGAMYMWRSLRRALDSNNFPILDAQFLSQLTNAQFDQLFSDDNGDNPLSVAREDRILNLRDLGTRLLSHWNGNFYNLVRESRSSLVNFVQFSQDFRAFDDPLRKLPMLNAIMHKGSAIADFADQPLPAIDYHLMKQLLRQTIIQPADVIVARLSRRDLLSSEEGFELRRAALCALVELSRITDISGDRLDNLYWFNRTNCAEHNPVCTNPATAHECPFLDPCAKRLGLPMPLEVTRYY